MNAATQAALADFLAHGNNLLTPDQARIRDQRPKTGTTFPAVGRFSIGCDRRLRMRQRDCPRLSPPIAVFGPARRLTFGWAVSSEG